MNNTIRRFRRSVYVLLLAGLVSCADRPQPGPKPRPDLWDRSFELRAYNAILMAQQHSVDVVLAGDSILAWIRLPDLWPDPLVVNRAFGGDDSDNLRQRFTAEVASLKPQRVVACIGTNDFWWPPDPDEPRPVPEVIEHLVQNVRQIHLTARNHGIQLHICSLLPVNPNLKWGAERSKWIPLDAHARANAALAHLCDELGMPFIDLYTPLLDAEGHFAAELSLDGIHPNVAGQAVMVKTIRGVLARPGGAGAE